MSEYQYYEFQAIDRPLTLLLELRSRLRVSASRKPVVLSLLQGGAAPPLARFFWGQFTPPKSRSRGFC